MKAVLGRKRSGDQGNVVEKARIEFLAKPGQSFGDQHVIDAILKIGMFAAHVELPKGILRHARSAQQSLVERGIVSLGLSLNLARADGINRGAQIRGNLRPVAMSSEPVTTMVSSCVEGVVGWTSFWGEVEVVWASADGGLSRTVIIRERTRSSSTSFIIFGSGSCRCK